jgi:hypothetical protein
MRRTNAVLLALAGLSPRGSGYRRAAVADERETGTRIEDPTARKRRHEGSGEPGETEKERLDRNFQELLQGLRVALPGVQVLFAFLLILPFQQGYVKVTEFQ